MNLLKLMHKTGVDRMQVSLINGEPHPAIVALADELEAHWKKTVTERDEYAQELRDQVEKLAEECVVLRASSRSKLETISSLELQVEKLTKERDELHRAFNQPVPRSEWEKMQEQLAALAELTEIAAQAKRLGVTVDPAQALARGVTPDALRQSVLKQAAERDVAQDIVAEAPAPASTKPQSVADSPLVKAAQAYGAQK